MDVQRLVAPNIGAQLADGFEKRLAFNIADRAADFDDHHIGIVFLADQRDPAFDLVGDVRDHLDRPAQIIAPALFADHFSINLPGGHVAGAIQVFIGEAFVMAQIEIGFRAVGGDEDFAVLVRTHRAGIDIQIGIELLNGDLQAACFENSSNGGGGDAFADRADDAPGAEDVFRHDAVLPVDSTNCPYKRAAGRSRLGACTPRCSLPYWVDEVL